MKRLFPLLLTLLLFPLPGCGLGNGIPRGLDWQALTVTDQKGGALLSAAPGWEGGKDVPRLSLSVQVEADSVVLTRPETGERWSGTLAPARPSPTALPPTPCPSPAPRQAGRCMVSQSTPMAAGRPPSISLPGV